MIVTRSKREKFIKRFDINCKSLIVERCQDNPAKAKVIINGVHIFYVDIDLVKEYL